MDSAVSCSMLWVFDACERRDMITRGWPGLTGSRASAVCMQTGRTLV
jgi:hypothetical protein